MNWKEIQTKYPEYREDMTKEREQEFVKDCFDCYEAEGFSEIFWTPWEDYSQYIGKRFTVVGRVTEKGEYEQRSAYKQELEFLPMWVIHFTDTDEEIGAYPEEIIPREMKDNGCRLENIL